MHVFFRIAMPLALAVAPAWAEPLAELRPGHPRLLVLGPDAWASLRTRSSTDAELGKVTERIVADATWLLNQPPLEYEKKGKRLLDVSRQALQRVILWSMARHLEQDDRFAKRAEREMLVVAAFDNWNPSHFLDTAEMTAALALGYDWLNDDLAPESRTAIREAIVELGLKPGLETTRGKRGWFRTSNNWNQVCLGGLTLGALAIAEEHPELAAEFLEDAREGIAAGLKPYQPDGLYPEGPSYWDYGTIYQCLMIEALRSALGTSWDLEKAPGFLESAAAQLQMTGPSGQFYNFFDGGAGPALHPAMFWFARELQDSTLLHFQQGPLRQALGTPVSDSRAYRPNRLFGMIALWWDGLPGEGQAPDLPLVWKADGENPVAAFRSSWTKPDALYLAAKGGKATLSHGHMDAGSFILEADGVRWALDLGNQSYLSLESKGVQLWDKGQKGDRWKVFRLNNRSHNTLTIDGELHQANGMARIIDFRRTGAVLDLSEIFKGQAARVVRRFEVGEGKVIVCDELSGLEPGAAVRWAMVTKAQVETEGRQATLRQEGKTLHARLACPEAAAFSVIPAKPPEDGFNAPNPGARILMVEVPAPASGELRIEVFLERERP